jgi:hypothetical protein
LTISTPFNEFQRERFNAFKRSGGFRTVVRMVVFLFAFRVVLLASSEVR